jgi:hypothetical protein
MINLEALVSDLEGKTEPVLRSLYADALTAESDAKKELYVLRQRLANLPTNHNLNEEKLLADAKSTAADAITYLRAIEAELSGSVKDITGIRFTQPAVMPIADENPTQVTLTVPDTSAPVTDAPEAVSEPVTVSPALEAYAERLGK